MVLYEACSPAGDFGPVLSNKQDLIFKSVCECRANRIRDRARATTALKAQTTRFLPDDIIHTICKKIRLDDTPVTQAVAIDIGNENILVSAGLNNGTVPLCHCIQKDLSTFRKLDANFYVEGHVNTVSLILAAVGSGCIKTGLMPMLYENGTLSKFPYIGLRNSECVFLSQETHLVWGSNIRPVLPLVMRDFTNLDEYIDIVYARDKAMNKIGVSDLWRKEAMLLRKARATHRSVMIQLRTNYQY